MSKKYSYIKITGVSDKMKDELKNISKNSGITLSQMLKPKLREFCESFPPEMKKKYSDD